MSLRDNYKGLKNLVRFGNSYAELVFDDEIGYKWITDNEVLQAVLNRIHVNRNVVSSNPMLSWMQMAAKELDGEVIDFISLYDEPLPPGALV